MANEFKTSIIAFQNKGIISRVDPRAIPPGAFQYMSNVMSEVEGSITPRRGRLLLGGPGAMPPSSYPTFLYKLVLFSNEIPVSGRPGALPSLNPRYIQNSQFIYRTADFVTYVRVDNTSYPAPCPDPLIAISRLWSMTAYDSGSAGVLMAFFACQGTMAKDNGTQNSLLPWGIPPALGVASAASGGSGNLNSSAPGSSPYYWVYTYRDPLTGNEGNPSMPMSATAGASSAPLNLTNSKATVTVYQTDTPQITGTGSIAIYRAGGSFADGLYRFVGYATNNQFAPFTTVTFTDNVSDAALAGAQTVFYDNDPPVTSSLTNPIQMTLSGGPYGNGKATISGASLSPNNISKLNTGTTAHFLGTSTTLPEDVILYVDKVQNQITFYSQFQHTSGEILEVDAVRGSPCNLTTTAFDSVFVAGDPNNPHVLYKSKTGLPESFPVIDALGNPGTLNVGSPSDPIMNICEFRGNVVCLTAQHIYEVPVFQGVMYSPNVTPAQRGLSATKAFCIADNEIWYLAYDGVYSWNGGESIKRSEPIDQIFHGEYTPAAPGGTVIPPLSYNPLHTQLFRMEYYRGQVHLLYIDSFTISHDLFYDSISQRWLLNDKNVSTGLGNTQQSAMYLERDTGNFIYARGGGVFCADDVVDSSSNVLGTTSDEYRSSGGGASGSAISWSAATGWMDFGNEFSAKVFDEVWLDVDVEPILSGTALIVNAYYDYTFSITDAVTVNMPVAGRQWICINLNMQADANLGGLMSTFARQCSVIAFKFSGATASGARPTIYAIKTRYRELADSSACPYYDWDSAGSRFDKRFYEMTIEFDTNVWLPGGTSTFFSHQLIMDTLTGVQGNVVNQTVQTFTISNRNTTPISPGRALCTFPIQDGVVAKMVRIRSVPYQVSQGLPSTNYFRIMDITFKVENYPPDISLFTEWEDDGSPFLKYANQILLDVDTGGIQVIVQVQADGATMQTFPVVTTSSARDATITLNPGLKGRKWRLFISSTDPGLLVGGKFQLFSHKFVFQPADRGPVGHSFDWDDLGWPYDKRLMTVNIEYDNTGNPPVTLQMDIKGGINGGTLTPNVASFVLSDGRSKVTFGVPADTIAKMVRIYPVSDTTTYLQWKYTFTKVDYPPDTVYTTDWNNFGTTYDKNAVTLTIDADTNGIPAVVQVQEGAGGEGINPNVMTLVHTGTSSNRRASYAFPLDTYGKIWRLVSTPGGSGKFQLFDWQIDYISDPPDLVPFTPWNDFGYPYDKIARNLILDADTGGLQANVDLWADGAVAQTFRVTTTYTNRSVVIPVVANTIGKLWRLANRVVPGGKFKLFKWNLDYIKEPPAVTLVNTYEQTFGTDGWKWIKRYFLEYEGGPLTMTVTTDSGTLAVINLPAHTSRSIESGFFPASGPGPNIALNKSQYYAFTFASVNPPNATFKLYSSSYIDWLPWNAAQRESFQHFNVSSEMNLPVA